MLLRLGFVAVCFLLSGGHRPVFAELRVSSIFGDHMVLQRDVPVHVWGWTQPNQSVTVAIAGQEVQGTADAEGRFDVTLPPMKAGGPYELTLQADESRTFRDVLVGEVWLCSGQSNMQWSLSQARNARLEAMTANYPNIRLITLPQVGVQQPQRDFEGQWVACDPSSVAAFSAVGYFFGRDLHQALDVPVGLIDNAWGGSACEAWVRRDLLEADATYAALMDRWATDEANQEHTEAMQSYEEALARWDENGQGPRPKRPGNKLSGQHRPGNLYNGMLHPLIGFTLRGVIWYQGESNAGRAYQYRELFPLMIQNWREEWNQGDFPFYWVQLADFKRETPQPQDSSWAELREAQTMTMDRLPQTGQAVIIDLGEGNDIHPRNKQEVAHRLARWALANEYGQEIDFRSPAFRSLQIADGQAVLTFDHVGPGLRTFDVGEVRGFTIAGEDRAFVPAQAELLDQHTIKVWSEQVPMPVAVRYAWADNPICNVLSKNDLPLTPFRTDDWPGVTTAAH
ncbi:MAG: sialate O-acetylesterase [Planctomycetota bacterium]